MAQVAYVDAADRKVKQSAITAAGDVVYNDNKVNATDPGGILVYGAETRSVPVQRPDRTYRRKSVNDNYIVKPRDRIVGVNTSGGAYTLTLNAITAVDGFAVTIKDESGNASVNNITLIATGGKKIDGADTVIISTNYGKLAIYSDGNNYFTM